MLIFPFMGRCYPVIATTEPAQNGSILFKETLSCFSSTAYRNHKWCSWSMHREGNFDLQLHLEQKSLSPPPMEPKDRDRTGTWTPGLFLKPRSVNQEDPMLTPLPHMDELQDSPIKTCQLTLLHTCSLYTLKNSLQTLNQGVQAFEHSRSPGWHHS